MNGVEVAPFLVAATVFSGFYFPTFALVLIWLCCATRILYFIGYVKIGPMGRAIGALAEHLARLVFLGLMITTIVYLYKGEQKEPI